MTNISLMQVESIAECSPWSILQYFWPALSDNWSWKPILVFMRVAVLHRFYFLYTEQKLKRYTWIVCHLRIYKIMQTKPRMQMKV